MDILKFHAEQGSCWKQHNESVCRQSIQEWLTGSESEYYSLPRIMSVFRQDSECLELSPVRTEMVLLLWFCCCDKYYYQSNLWEEEVHFTLQVTAHPGGKSGHKCKHNLRADTMEECSLLANSTDPYPLAFLYSPKLLLRGWHCQQWTYNQDTTDINMPIISDLGNSSFSWV